MTTFFGIVLVLMYGIAVVIRWRAANLVRSLAVSYYVSIVCGIVYVCTSTWLIIDGESSARSTLARFVQIVSAAAVWIWPPYVAIRTRREQDEAIQRIINKAKEQQCG